MFKKIKRKLNLSIVAIVVATCCSITGCSQEGGYEGNKPAIPADPSKPVVFTNFFPKEGPVRTLIFIEGDNFGTDLENIEVLIGGVNAPVIGSSGKKICVMAPRRSNRGDVVVKIKDQTKETIGEYQFDELFNLQSALIVSTLAGKVDPQTNSSSIINGSFEEAEFQNPWWLEFDIDEEGNKIIYVIDAEGMAALRKINLTTEEVSTVFMKGQAGVVNVK